MTTWIGISLPGRPLDATYGQWSYQSLPPIEIDPQFQEITTLDQLIQSLSLLRTIISSPTACYFQVDLADRTFYRDQQDCVIWALNSQGQVYLDGDPHAIVALSLPEFLTRVHLENTIWWHNEYKHEQELTPQEQSYRDFYMCRI